MSQIVTITFNPTIDKSTTINALAPEKKLRCTAPKFEPGGGGINVSRAIKKLGGTSLAIFPAGGHTGEFLKSLLSEEDIDTLVVDTVSRTRENFIALDTSTNYQYRFGMPGSELKEQEWRSCLQKLEELKGVKFIVASGSLPPGVPEEVFAEIAAIAKTKGAKFIADTSGTALQKAAEEGVFLLKPNLGELSALLGKEEVRTGEAEEYAQELIRKYGSKVVVVSLGASGALLVTEENALQVVPPVVKKQSTVGAGDSMVAGIVHTLSQGGNIEEAVKYGVACGTAATMNAGTELCKLEDVQILLKHVKLVR